MCIYNRYPSIVVAVKNAFKLIFVYVFDTIQTTKLSMLKTLNANKLIKQFENYCRKLGCCSLSNIGKKKCNLFFGIY